jgi:hypothetical protein
MARHLSWRGVLYAGRGFAAVGASGADRDRAPKWAMAQLKARGHKTVLVDAAELKLPLLDKTWEEIKGSGANSMLGRVRVVD